MTDRAEPAPGPDGAHRGGFHGVSPEPPRLATYGSLGPGRPNHHHVAEITGEWTTGTVRGRLEPSGWGAALGFPGLVLDAAGDARGEAVPVDLLTSADLPAHWDRLDAFEGPGYARVVVDVATPAGSVPAWIYVLPQPGRAAGSGRTDG